MISEITHCLNRFNNSTTKEKIKTIACALATIAIVAAVIALAITFPHAAMTFGLTFGSIVVFYAAMMGIAALFNKFSHCTSAAHRNP